MPPRRLRIPTRRIPERLWHALIFLGIIALLSGTAGWALRAWFVR